MGFLLRSVYVLVEMFHFGSPVPLLIRDSSPHARPGIPCERKYIVAHSLNEAAAMGGMWLFLIKPSCIYYVGFRYGVVFGTTSAIRYLTECLRSMLVPLCRIILLLRATLKIAEEAHIGFAIISKALENMSSS